MSIDREFWRPVIEFANVGPERFRDFSEPGFAKHVYSLSVSPLDSGRTLLRAEMRIATTDARRGSGSVATGRSALGRERTSSLPA